MSFAQDLWDGFDVVKARGSDGNDFEVHISKFLHKVAGLSKDFGKGLISLSKSKDYTVYGEEKSETLPAAWSVFLEQFSALGQSYVQLSDELGKRIPDQINLHLKEAKKNRKPHIKRGKHIVSSLNKNENSASKSKHKLEKMQKKKEETMEEYEKAKSTNSQNVEKLSKKAEAETRHFEKADKEFTDNIEALKAAQEKAFKDEMPNILQALEEIEKERLSQMKVFLQEIVDALRPLPNSLSQTCQTMSDAQASINPQTDLQEFIYRNQSPASGPELVSKDTFIPSKSKKKGSILVPSARDTIRPDTNQPASTTKSSGPKETVYSLFDYNGEEATELSFPAGAPIKVLEKDSTGWWKGEYNGKIGMFPSNFVSNSPPSTIENQDYTYDQNGYDEEYSQCEALYDYDAEDPDELTIKTGEILSVHTEDEGWIYVYNQSNNYGRVPLNYIKYL